MITENEMRIANTSYINKDFAQIYPELLDIFKSLTSKYDPTTSNESDPGVVLLKLLGFIGDKLNYNVDKNVLECFAPSATQESSMRRILSPLGYEMGYYHGATTEVQFIYKGTDLDSDSAAKSFTFYKYKTILTDNDESTQFVLLENCTISAKNTAFKADAIEGRVEQLTSGDSETILLESIDSNNRIYFPVGQVAENGVWMRSVDNGAEWERVDNLNSQTPKQLVYRFGYDSSRGLPYIEFPSDLASIIGNGLLIDYVVCNGASGNISANTLTKLSSPTSGIAITGDASKTISFSEESGNDLLIIKNLSASVDGADPETIDEAYGNFKKTIGTFDTLVTCRDYANAIYNLENSETGSAIVSNCQVTDRRDDLMRSTRVVSFDEYGQYETNVKNKNNEDVDANDIFLYPLSPIRAYTKAGYVESFQPLQSTRYIENALESQKLASHDYNNPTGLYCIKNKLGIKANISTTSKVNSYERLAIITNVTSALIRKFNAREVDYGQEIPYDSILETIEDADERISSVSLAEPSLTTYVMKDDGDETALISSNGLDFLLTILARNILAGRASLFDYDDDFSYEFGQKSIENISSSKLEGLSKISSETEIQLKSGNKASILKNEVVQLMAPSLVTSIQYVAYTYYNMNGLTSNVQANTNYRLKDSEKLTITYTDSSTSQEVTRVYGAGQIIKPNFELSNTIGKKDDNGNERKSGKYTSGVVEKKVTIDGKVVPMWFVALKANETIDIEQLNSKEFNEPTYFYWIRSNSKNKLFPEGAKSGNTYETVLGDNEYLFYTDDGFTSLATLGSGTTVKCVGMDASDWEAPTISYEEVYENGLLSLQDKWQYKTLSGTETLTVQENSILTLVAGDDITWTADSSTKKTMTLGNTFQDIAGSISYTSNGTSGTWEGYGIDGVSTRIRSRLDIDAGPSLAQSITNARQSIKFIPIKEDESGGYEDDDANAVTLGTVGQEFNLNTQLQFAGSDSIDVSSLDLVTNKTKYPVSAYFHVQQEDGASRKTVSRNADGYLTYTIKYGVETGDGKPFSYDIPALDETKVIMLYANIDDGYQLKVSSDSDKEYLRVFNKSGNETFAKNINISKSGICNIEIAPDAGSLKIELEKTSTDSESSEGSATIILGKLRYIREDGESSYGYALNPDLGISGEVPETLKDETRLSLKGKLLEMIRNLDNGGKLDLTKDEYKGLAPLFYYTCDIDNAKVIESDDLTSPEALYDSNNVANKMAISEIDLSALDVDVVRSSRL